MTAVSETAIANLALQKLGAARIVSLTQDKPTARSMNACYELIRDRELRAYVWGFAKTGASLAADAAEPADAFLRARAFVLPADYLRLLKPRDRRPDWLVVNHQGNVSIVTNDSAPLEIVYIARITDTTRFDAVFIDALACKLAWHTCEEITQSNQKKADILAEYRISIAEARRTNAIEKESDEAPEDDWVTVRR